MKRGRCEFTVFDDHTCELCDLVLEGVRRRVVMLGPWAGKGAPKFVCTDCITEAVMVLENNKEEKVNEIY